MGYPQNKCALIIGGCAPFLSTITMILPLELVMHICDTVAESDDKETLENCALACSQLAGHCRRHLFATVKLDIYDIDDLVLRHVERLARVVEENPKIGPCIKSIAIHFASYDEGPCLPALLAKCTGIETLSLSTYDIFSEGDTIWPGLIPKATRASLEVIISSDTLNKLSISGFQLPILFLSGCHCSLSHLTICGERSPIFPTERGTPGPAINLRCLDARPVTISSLTTAKRQDGGPVFDFSNLRELATRFEELEDHAQHISDLLHCKRR